MSARQDWFRDQKWGIFTHYLYGCQNNADAWQSMGRGGDWSECVDEFDTEKLADQLAEIGAHYLIFTVMQGHQYMCAPNAAFDRITGYRPGEACARRDLIEDLYASLSKRGISLLLYYTGDGPYKDEAKAGPAMGFIEPREEGVTDEFVKNWTDVLREYAVRYGDKVKGWWVDGCYTYFKYTDANLKPYADAIRAGNPEALIAFNGGVKERVFHYSQWDDYTCGEMNSFADLPDDRFIGGSQWHSLAPLGVSADGREWGGWCRPGCKHTAEHMREYVRAVNAKGGVVSIDVGLMRDGSICPEQIALLKEALKA